MIDPKMPEPDGRAETNKERHPEGGYTFDEVPAWSEPLVRAYAEALAAHRVAPLKVRILELEAAHEDASGAILEAVAAERERWTEAVMAELDSNGQAEAIVRDVTGQPPATGK